MQNKKSDKKSSVNQENMQQKEAAFTPLQAAMNFQQQQNP